MAIVVVCPHCRKRFNVSEKFAGQTGPCPACKKPLKVPSAAEEIKVHAPENFEGGGRSGTTGKLVLKPITREKIRFRLIPALLISVASIAIFAAAWIGGASQLFESGLIRAVGLLLISPLLIVAAYSFLYDDELEPYSGKPLWIRTLALSLAYVVLWGLFVLTAPYILEGGELWSWLILGPPFFLVGAALALALLDMEFGNASMLYSFYIFVTILLGWFAGLGWVWNIQSTTPL